MSSQPSSAPKFTVVSTFSGCGGSSKGYELAGGKVRLAVEWDAHATKCYRLNFPDTEVYHGDVGALSVEEACALADVEPGQLDLFDGSPLCQGFSTTGKRMLDDPRNTLFKEYVRLLNGLRPRAFVMENVSGMVKGKMKLVFAQILRELRSCGYVVKAWLLNAKWFGVPQSRERMIFIGVREDLEIVPSHPAPTSSPISVRQALEGVPECDVPMDPFDEQYAYYWPYVPVGGTLADVMAQIRGKRSHFNDLIRLDPEKPSRTLMATVTSRGYATICHWKEPRAITVAEAKRLHSFPDDFRLVGKYQEQMARIGNSVPPLLMKAIAEHVLKTILEPAREAVEAA